MGLFFQRKPLSLGEAGTVESSTLCLIKLNSSVAEEFTKLWFIGCAHSSRNIYSQFVLNDHHVLDILLSGLLSFLSYFP